MGHMVRQPFDRIMDDADRSVWPNWLMLWAGIMISLLSYQSDALADGLPLVPKDVGFKTGLATGKVTVQETVPATLTKPQTTSSTTYQVGGIAMLLSWHESLSAWLDSDYAAKVLVDRANNQVLSYGGEASAHIHFLGGSRRLSQGTENVVLKTYYDHNLSLVVKAGAHQYSSQIKGATFKGAAVDIRSGVEYRQDVSRNVALGGEVTTTVTSIAMGSPTLTPRTSEFLLFVRYAP